MQHYRSCSLVFTMAPKLVTTGATTKSSSSGAPKGSTTGKGNSASMAQKVNPSISKKKAGSSPQSSPAFHTPNPDASRAIPVTAMPAVPPLPSASALGNAKDESKVITSFLQTLAAAAGQHDALNDAGIPMSQISPCDADDVVILDASDDRTGGVQP